jgi:hypothetical protein
MLILLEVKRIDKIKDFERDFGRAIYNNRLSLTLRGGIRNLNNSNEISMSNQVVMINEEVTKVKNDSVNDNM